jgi:hypothetical protein
MVRRIIHSILAGGIAGFLVMANLGAAYASWSSTHCTTGSGTVISSLTRGDALSYSATADGDGYEWGGGCWNSNRTDDTPNQPDSEGEGPDCSGFTFKTWHLRSDWAAGYVRYGKMQNIHGPYTAQAFHDGTGVPRVKSKGYADTDWMDAFASASHIGMIYAEGSSGYDAIIEAKSDATGTGLWQRSYRSSTSYNGVGRTGWS